MFVSRKTGLIIARRPEGLVSPVKPPPEEWIEEWIQDANARKRLTFDALLAVRQEPSMRSPTSASDEISSPNIGSPESTACGWLNK
jgi:hypothetical protein